MHAPAAPSDPPWPKPVPRKGWRWYEWAFLLTAGCCAAALLLARKWGEAAEALAGTIVYAALLAWSAPRGRFRVRASADYGFMLWFYGASSRISLALGVATWDGVLYRFDRLLTARPLDWQIPWLTDAMSFCYLAYLVYLQWQFFWVWPRSQGQLERWCGTVLPGFAVGFLGYLLMPALGPAAAYPGLFPIALSGGAIARLNHFVFTNGNAVYSTFPSLHLLNTLLLLRFDWHECRWRFWTMLGPAFGVAFSTIYLRYHYLADLIAAALLFGLSLMLWRPWPVRPSGNPAVPN